MEDKSEAKVFLNQCRADFPDANHHCWAYLLGDPANAVSAAMSDDGEPSGTAGKPILNVLQHKGVGDIMIVVSRYFGGVRLGAGGLVRAYSSAAQQVMDHLKTQERQLLTTRKVVIDFQGESVLRRWLTSRGGILSNITYSEQVTCEVSIPQSEVVQLLAVSASYGWFVPVDD